MSSINQLSTPIQTNINNFLQFDLDTELVTSKLTIHKKPSKTDLVLHSLSCGILGTSLEKTKRYDLAKIRKSLENKVQAYLKESEDKVAAVKTAKEVYTKFNTLLDKINNKRDPERRYDTKLRFEKNGYEPILESILVEFHPEETTPQINIAKEVFNGVIPESIENPFPKNSPEKEEENNSSSTYSPSQESLSSENIGNGYLIDNFVVINETPDIAANSIEEELEEDLSSEITLGDEQDLSQMSPELFIKPTQKVATENDQAIGSSSTDSSELIEQKEEASSTPKRKVSDTVQSTPQTPKKTTPSTSEERESWVNTRGSRLRNTPKKNYSEISNYKSHTK